MAVERLAQGAADRNTLSPVAHGRAARARSTEPAREVKAASRHASLIPLRRQSCAAVKCHADSLSQHKGSLLTAWQGGAVV